MSNAGRLALLAVAAVVLVAAFALLRPDGDDGGASPAADAAPAQRTTAPATSTAPRPTTPTTDEPAPAPKPEPPLVVVRDGEVLGDRRTIAARSGDEVVLRVRADVADEVHVHGYDLHADVRPGRTATLRFDAALEGVFEVELEAAGLQIVELRVTPS